MKAVEYFLNGNSCSESILLNASEKGLIDSSLVSLATPFSGGIGSGCLCGAVAGVLLVIGNLYGKNNKYGNPPIAKQLAKKFIEDFKASHKATCCRVLSRGLEFGSPERKQHCTNFVEHCSKILDEITKDAIKNV